jgi:hypothetical protein
MKNNRKENLSKSVSDTWRSFTYLVLWCFSGLLMYGCVGSVWASDKDKFSMTFDKVTVQQLVMVFYDQCEKRGLVFDPKLSKLDTVITLKTQLMTCSQTRPILLDALSRSGAVIEHRSGFDVIRESQIVDERDNWRHIIYRPKFRDPLELAQQSQIAIRKGFFSHQRRGGISFFCIRSGSSR